MSRPKLVMVKPGTLQQCPKRPQRSYHRFERHIRRTPRKTTGSYQDGLFCEFCGACLYKWQTIKSGISWSSRDPNSLLEGLTREDMLALDGGAILTRRYVDGEGSERAVVRV